MESFNEIEYNKENYEQMIKNVEVVLEIGEKNNQLYYDVMKSGLIDDLEGEYGKEISKSYTEYYSAFLGNVRDLISKTMDEFNKLNGKGEKEAYDLNKKYDDLRSKMGYENSVVKQFEQEQLGMKDKKEE